LFYFNDNLNLGDALGNKYIISIDMGGTKILACAVNSSKGIIGRVKKPTKLGASPASYVKSLAGITKDLIRNYI
jgi:predicted NBD/HSP70 family sugar kinase